MNKRIALIQGHPDPSAAHLLDALATAYAQGASRAGHVVTELDVATMMFPVLRTADEWENGTPCPAIAAAQSTIRAAQHLAIFYPLWMGDMPALLKAFFEQTFRPGMRLDGKSARVVVTMGMPSMLYRSYFGARTLKSLERELLAFVGVKSVHHTLYGSVENAKERKREHWFESMRELGAKAS